MASPFETEGTFLTQEQADHINERHVLRLLKAGNSGGLPSLSLLVFRSFYVRESPAWTFWGLSCNLLVILSSASGGGQAHQLCRPSSLA